jgi:undecaprenyl-diphosphatase
MEWFEAILLGLVQGLTEFLPVSSSGHLTIGKELLGIETSNLKFEVVVHAATVTSTLVVFRKDILNLLSGLFKFKMNPETEYIFKIAVSMIPVFVIGMFFKDQVEAIFGSGLLIVGISLLVTASLLRTHIREGLYNRNCTSCCCSSRPFKIRFYNLHRDVTGR